MKALLDLSNYATIKELWKEHAAGIDTSDSVAENHFVVLQAEVDKLDINKLTNVSTSLNKLKIKVNNLDVCKPKTFPWT